MISSAAIDAIGPDGLLVNVARGQLVDEDALIDALRRGRLGAAALDVFATEPTPPSRWEGVPNIICTPHIAGASRNNLSKMTAMLRSNPDAFFSGSPVPNPARAMRERADSFADSLPALGQPTRGRPRGRSGPSRRR